MTAEDKEGPQDSEETKNLHIFPQTPAFCRGFLIFLTFYGNFPTLIVTFCLFIRISICSTCTITLN